MFQTAILHLSDIHIRCEGDESFDFGVVFDPLIDRIKEDREEKNINVELVFFTGDIAFQGKKEEYDIAAKYLTRLMQELDLPPERLFIVPGNHDVNRKLYRPSDLPSYRSMRDLNKELENTDFRSDLFKGQQAYFDFINSHFPHLTTLNDNLIPFVQTYETKSGHVLGLLGLNSAWMCRRSPDKGAVAIGEYQLNKGKAHLKTRGNTNLNLACFHHPVSWLWKEDQSIARTSLDKFVLLTGHLHDASGGFQNDTEGQIFFASAGGAYWGSDSNYPMGYHYLMIDWGKQTLRLDFRTFFEKKRKWILDAIQGKDGVAEISCSFIDWENSVELEDESESLKPSSEAAIGRDKSGLFIRFPISNRKLYHPWGNLGEDQLGIYTDYQVNGVAFRLRCIRPGQFMMGSPDDESKRDDDETRHKITLTRGFWLAYTACTQALWQAVMKENPSKFKGEELPVDSVSWEDCQTFLAQINGLLPGFDLGLPTEAQWEYACRAGTRPPFSFGGTLSTNQANFNGYSPYAGGKKGEDRSTTVPVKALPCNDWGLYQMHGNVYEWCRDWHGDYDLEHLVDPEGPDAGEDRVLRGGSWIYDAGRLRSAFRFRNGPSFRNDFIGFRLAQGH